MLTIFIHCTCSCMSWLIIIILLFMYTSYTYTYTYTYTCTYTCTCTCTCTCTYTYTYTYTYTCTYTYTYITHIHVYLLLFYANRSSIHNNGYPAASSSHSRVFPGTLSIPNPTSSKYPSPSPITPIHRYPNVSTSPSTSSCNCWRTVGILTTTSYST